MDRIKQSFSFFRAGLVIAVICCGLTEAFFRAGTLDKLEHLFFDTWHIMAGVRPDYAPHVTLVSIDEKTLTAFKEDPMVFWGPYFARALSALRQHGVKMAGMDLIFGVSPESWLMKIGSEQTDLSNAYDMGFREQLNSGQVILAGKAKWGKEGELSFMLPHLEYLYSLPDGPGSVGLVNLLQDKDGVIRTFLTRVFKGTEPPHTGFAALLASRAGFALPEKDVGRIGYVGPPGTVPRISMADLVTKETLDPETVSLIKDRIAVITVEDAGFNDFHATPYTNALFSGQHIRLMGGAEIHANIIETLITGRAPRDIPDGIRLFWLTAMAAIAALFFRRLGPKVGIVALLGLSGICLAASYGCFLADVLAPVAHMILAMTGCYMGVLGLRLTREEKERRHLESVFTPYVSESVLSALMTAPEKPSLGGEEKDITILFSDIRSFTTLSESLAPQEVVEMLNRYLSGVCDMITEKGGIVDKFIGDAVMAVFGAPMPLKNHARLGVETAVELVANAGHFRGWLKERFPDRDIPDFNIGVGLHSGKALIGNIGSRQRMEYTAIGDTINIASRLEGMCKTLGWTIVASDATINAAGKPLDLGAEEQVQPRGRKGRIKIYEVRGMGEQPVTDPVKSRDQT